MNIRGMVNETLQYLFEGYEEHHGAPIFDISPVAQKYNINPHELGQLLVQNGWVRNQRYLPTGFECSISLHGISEIKPDYFENHFSTIVSTLGVSGGEWMGTLEALGWERTEYQRAHDLAKALEAMNVVETQFHYDEVYLKLTLTGRQYYEDRKPTFF